MNGVELTIEGPRAHIVLDRPDAANALDLDTTRALAAAAEAADGDSAVKVVSLTGAGRFFCVGGDLGAMAQNEHRARQYVKELADALHRAISTLARMDAPLIVAVNGVAAGAGMSLALIGDLVVAAEEARFTMAYTRAGLSPDGSSTFFLPRLVGLRRAQELMYTNRTLTAAEALEWGLVHQAVPASQLSETADRLAADVVNGARGANASVKRLLLSTFASGLEEQMELEGRAISACAGSEDGHEGVAAFLAKRPPAFS